MRAGSRALLVACLATLSFGSAAAGEIYRYVDDDGNVNYVDRPTGAPDEQRLSIASEPTDAGAVEARVAARRSAANEDDEAEAARAEQEQKCRDYRERLERYVTSRRLYRENEAGERVYLDEAQRREARAKVEELIAKSCT
jgi:hypothetical protein